MRMYTELKGLRKELAVGWLRY